MPSSRSRRNEFYGTFAKGSGEGIITRASFAGYLINLWPNIEAFEATSHGTANLWTVLYRPRPLTMIVDTAYLSQ